MIILKHPSGVIQSKQNKTISYGNRGISLEEDINLTNIYYVDEKIAYIYKKPTPIQINKTEYGVNGPRIKDAFFKEASTTDYNGLYNGKYIDFDAKEISSKTSFPLKNIPKHQLNHLKNIDENGGIAFLIIRFTSLEKTYLLMARDIFTYMANNKAKSIAISFFESSAYEIELKYRPRLDYLKIIDKIYGGINE